jgi:dienelactone hydrolase
MRTPYLLLLPASIFLAAAQELPVSEKARQAVDLLLQGNYSELIERFSPQMKKALPEEALRSAVQPKLQTFGSVQKIGEPRMQRVQEMDVAIVPVQFAKTAIDFQITFNKAGKIAGLFLRPGQPATSSWRHPPYSKPDSFHDEEVTVGAGEWQLPGTLSLPSGKGPFPAVVLVHGSGPNDRDETVGANKPFRDLAEGLASRGIAVLRYEKRTRQYGAKLSLVKDLTVQQETVEDAALAADLLRKRPDIKSNRICVLGHSLGGYVAPRIAQENPKIACLIIMAGNTRPLEDLVLDQVSYLSSLEGRRSSDQLKKLKQLADTVKQLKPGNNAPSRDLLLGVPISYWLDLKGYNPSAEAGKLALPMLILQGERDYQVTMADFNGWKEALKDHKNVTFRSYTALNHLFITGEGKSKPAEYSQAGHVAVEVIDEISAWVKRL